MTGLSATKTTHRMALDEVDEIEIDMYSVFYKNICSLG